MTTIKLFPPNGKEIVYELKTEEDIDSLDYDDAGEYVEFSLNGYRHHFRGIYLIIQKVD